MEYTFRKRRRNVALCMIVYLNCFVIHQIFQCVEAFSLQTPFYKNNNNNNNKITKNNVAFTSGSKNVCVQVQSPFIILQKSSCILYATKGSKVNNDDEDIPEDWSEDDILAEFGDDVVVGDDDVDVDVDIEIDDVDTDVTVALTEEGKTINNSVDEIDDDEDDDELDLDEIDLDEDDDEEIDDEDELSLVEETLGEYINDDNDEQDSSTIYSSKGNNDNADIIQWDPEEDGIDYELEDDITDINYMKQKQIVNDAIEASDQRNDDESFDAYEFVTNYEFTSEQINELNQSPLLLAVEEKARNMMITEMDVEGMDLEKEYNEVSDLMLDDPYPRHEDGEINILEENTGITDDDMEELDKTYKSIQETLELEPWDKVMLTSMNGFDGLSNLTLAEMDDCLSEIGGSAYNVTNWLLYDLNYNVSNLILAAIKHNPDAPILFQHWYPQLVTYTRYEHARIRNFDFSWNDVENSDIIELENYYKGFGYDTIPSKAPSETGIISLEDLDEEEIKMAAFENWMTEVYNPEGDRKDFDDDTLRDEDNVFSDYYETPQHPDLPVFEDAVEDLDNWKEELGDDAESDDLEIKNYRNMMGRSFDYTVIQDEEFEREFRGHLVIACTGDDNDLEIAESITKRFNNEFGKKVYVETRVMALARDEDNVFEIWLESYDIDLLHSKKRATSNTKDWDGPAEVDDAQIDYLTERVRFLISDDARYSYRLELEYAD